jgi:rsbT co-antagonist protein RsbR
MKNEMILLGEKIIESKYEIARRVHEMSIDDVGKEGLKKLELVEIEILNIRADFIHLFGESLKNHMDTEATFLTILKWGNETGTALCEQGVPLEGALQDTTHYRMCIWEVIKEEVKKQNMSVDAVFKFGSIFDPLLDHAVHSFSLAYIHSYNETLDKSRMAFLELSVPVVPITNGLAVLPLIGNIDVERAYLLMEEALKRANQLNLSHLILDLSGVLVIDTMVADQIFKIIAALKLIGVETVVTGVRPEIAQTMVNLGLGINHLTLKANLEQALSDLKRTGIV